MGRLARIGYLLGTHWAFYVFPMDLGGADGS